MPRLAALGTLSILAALAGPAARAQETAPPSMAEGAAGGAVPTAPVVIDGEELFRLRGVSALPAAERARTVESRIIDVARDASMPPDAVDSAPGDDADSITASGQPLLMVTDADAQLEGVDRAILSKALVPRIRNAIESYRAARTPAARATGAAVSAGALLGLCILLWILRAVFRSLRAMLARRLQRTVQSIETRSLSLFQADRIWMGLGHALTGLHLVLAIGAGLWCLSLVLRSFPWTRGAAEHLLDSLLHPMQAIGEAMLAYIPSLMFLLVLGAVTWLALKFLRLLFSELERGAISWEGFYTEWAQPTYKLVRILVLAFAVVIAYPYLPGSGSEAFKGVSLFLGVIFSLGSSSAISNIIAGYLMTYRRAFHIGDRIRIGDELGDVEQTRLLVTHLRTIKNEEVIIPNSNILNSNVVNYSSLARERGLMIQATVGIGYETPWRQVEAMLLAAAARTPGLRPEPRPFILQRTLGDFAVEYVLCVFTDDPRRVPFLTTEVHRNILDEFNTHGVQIMTPAYEGDPETPKVVPKERWHESPARPPDRA